MANRTVRFGDFEVDVHSGELRKHGRTIKLQEKPFQILEILLEEPGDMVSRQELAERLWPADTFVDFERGLNKRYSRPSTLSISIRAMLARMRCWDELTLLTVDTKKPSPSFRPGNPSQETVATISASMIL